MNTCYFYYFCRLFIHSRKQVQNLAWKLESLFELNGITISCSLPIIFEVNCLVLLNDLFHDWGSLLHEFLESEGLVFSFLFSLVSISVSIVVYINIIRRLIELMIRTKIIRLTLLIKVIISRANNSSLDRA